MGVPQNVQTATKVPRFQFATTVRHNILIEVKNGIDFTMIITSRNNAPISNFGGGFRCKSEYPCCIIEVKNH
ncbi:Uncharacterized protein FWK35_00007755 [Aphis craccivora]|uniref:Uncharacterized protein n=1 Tax=Aphis craccivora TaxID=307492 RepID=A0A6G0Y9G5_APHCR|nr:Uncharacterized protein FWK35_00007755 [Aphis craccivora]